MQWRCGGNRSSSSRYLHDRCREGTTLYDSWNSVNTDNCVASLGDEEAVFRSRGMRRDHELFNMIREQLGVHRVLLAELFSKQPQNSFVMLPKKSSGP
jgi:hypothetical protein